MAKNWFFNRVLITIQKFCMLNKGDRVLVAVSGGSDSIGLLHFLNQIAPVYDLDLLVFHLNHQIRGKEADEDAEFVEEFAERLGIPAIIKSYNVPALVEQENISLEEAAREVRYRFMDQISLEIKANKIALGHHLNDQVETFLMRIIRGAGLEGLRSILPVRGPYIRPFIEISKKDILRYIEDNKLEHRIDASNEDLSILRNRVRHELVPLLNDYNPQFSSALLRTVEVVREDQAHLDELTDEVFEALADVGNGIVRLPIQGLVAQSVSLQRRLVRKCIKWVKSNLRGIEFRHVETVLEKLRLAPARVEVELPDNIIVFSDYDRLVLGKKQLFEPPPVDPVDLVVPGITTVKALGVEIKAELLSPIDLIFGRNGKIAHLDMDKIPGELQVRTRKPGDSFRPFGMTGEKKLQDFFVDEKVSKRERDWVPVITSGGSIVWVAGFRIDDRFKVTGETESVLELRLL